MRHRTADSSIKSVALKINASETAIDLVVSDYSMLRMSGIELRGKAREIRPDLPLRLTTGYSDLPGEDEGGLARLVKPSTQADLACAINERLGRP